MKVKGYGAQTESSPIGPIEFERREPGPSDVLIKINYSGICHSDIHTVRNEWGGNTPYPCIPGHEIIGTVESVGSSVSKFKVGDAVGVGCMVDSCKECGSCTHGLEQFCQKGATFTYSTPSEAEPGGHTHGGYSTHIVVRDEFVLSVPSNLDPAAAAPLLCAGITTYSPLKYVGVKSGHQVAVLGLGGLGHMGVKLAKSMGAEVTVISRSDSKKADAERLGATGYINSSDPEQMTAAMGRFDFILDTVSAKHDLGAYLSLLKMEGTLILVGAADEPLDLAPFPLIFGRKKMLGSLIGGIQETQEMLDHCGKHEIVSDIEMINADQINEAYDRTVKGDVKFRFVIDAKTF